MKHIQLFRISVALLGVFVSGAFATPLSSASSSSSASLSVAPTGTGTGTDPYIIDSLPNLYWFSQTPSAWADTLIQTSNIDATATSTWANGAGFSPIGNGTTKFTGSYNGKGHAIRNLSINSTGATYVGLFGYLDTKGVIDSLGLVSASLIADAPNVGALVGYNAGSVQNSFATGSTQVNVTSNNTSVGGLVGYNTGTIQSTYAANTIQINGANFSNIYAGGLVGSTVGASAILEKDFASGSVTIDAVTQMAPAGGLVGAARDGASINNCYATGATISHGPKWIYAAGLVGLLINGAKVQNSYATGTAEVTASSTNYTGGVVGQHMGTMQNCFWDSTSSKQASSFGHASSGSSGEGIALNSAQMDSAASFPSLDFTGTWTIYEGHTNPLLLHFLRPLVVQAQSHSITYKASAYSGGNGVQYQPSNADTSLILGSLAYGGTSQGAIDTGHYSISPQGLYSSQLGYIISYQPGTLAISPYTLTISGITASDKVYDATTTVTLSSGTLDAITGDDVTLVAGSGSFANANVGTAKSVSASGYSISGNDASNYTLGAQPTGLAANITPKKIHIAANADTIMQGATSPTLTYVADSLLAGDSLTGALTREVGDTAGTYAILIGTLSAGGNYTIDFASANVVITAPESIRTNAPSVAFTGRASATIFNLQGKLVWFGSLDVINGHVKMPSIGEGRWVVKLQMGNTARTINTVEH